MLYESERSAAAEKRKRVNVIGVRPDSVRRRRNANEYEECLPKQQPGKLFAR